MTPMYKISAVLRPGDAPPSDARFRPMKGYPLFSSVLPPPQYVNIFINKM